MRRRVITGLIVACCMAVGSGLPTPRTASAVMVASGNCPFELERCTDNAIGSYDDCVCNAEPYALDCAQAQPELAPTPTSSSVPVCVAGLQLNLSKCVAQYLACLILPKGKPAMTR
jgi:hypothetical protein